jgi:hypothetical protein
MACQIRKQEHVENPPYQNSPRTQRLQDLICTGTWGGDNNIVMLYWIKDATKPGGGYWAAWEDSPTPLADPLIQAGVSIAP